MLFRIVSFLLLALLPTGCVSPLPDQNNPARRFDFGRDTFAFTNETVWEYHFDPQSKVGFTTRKQPPPDYAHRCVVLTRSAKLFFYHAHFQPDQPAADAATCRRLVKRVLSRSTMNLAQDEKRIPIPGYADLRSFSAAQESLVKDTCGEAWQSYVQRGHWRMVFPFSRRQQARTASRLLATLRADHVAAVRLVRFPQLTINHALLLYDAEESAESISFLAYDPNAPNQPTHLIYDRVKRTFDLPLTSYFAGGRVDVYEIYRNLIY